MIEIAATCSDLYESHRSVEVPSGDQIASALEKDAVARRVMAKGVSPKPGDYVGSRLNLNVLKSTGMHVNTVHAPSNREGHRCFRGWYRGSVITYSPVVYLRDVYLNVHQSERNKIASGEAKKSPIASADGILLDRAPSRFAGIELRFNPHRERLFVDANNHPVHWVELAIVVGTRVYACGNIRYFENESEAPKKAGNAQCAVVFPSSRQSVLERRTRS